MVYELKNMPKYLVEDEKTNNENASFDRSLQSIDEVNGIESKICGEDSTTTYDRSEIGGSMDSDDDEFDLENEIDYNLQWRSFWSNLNIFVSDKDVF
ncbi:hypothetical protein LXL04_038872 [Taraxacum kok-saghyz]